MLAAKNDGSAMFYSPKKVQQAPERLEEQEIAKKSAQAFTADEKVQRSLHKEGKGRALEERKEQRI